MEIKAIFTNSKSFMCKNKVYVIARLPRFVMRKMGEKKGQITSTKVPDVNSRGKAFRQEVRLSKTLSLGKSEMRYFPKPS